MQGAAPVFVQCCQRRLHPLYLHGVDAREEQPGQQLPGPRGAHRHVRGERIHALECQQEDRAGSCE